MRVFPSTQVGSENYNMNPSTERVFIVPTYTNATANEGVNQSPNADGGHFGEIFKLFFSLIKFYDRKGMR